MSEDNQGKSGAPAKVKVKLQGREFEVDKDVGELLASQHRALTEKISQQEQMIQQLMDSSSEDSKPSDDSDDFDSQFFTNPRAVIEAEIEKVKQELTQQYTQAQQAEKQAKVFWDTFYTKHNDLKDHDKLVKRILNENYNSWASLPVDEAMEKLSTSVKDELEEIVSKISKKMDVEEDGGILFEGGSLTKSRSRKRKKGDEEEGPSSLTDLIRARRNKRLMKAS